MRVQDNRERFYQFVFIRYAFFTIYSHPVFYMRHAPNCLLSLLLLLLLSRMSFLLRLVLLHQRRNSTIRLGSIGCEISYYFLIGEGDGIVDAGYWDRVRPRYSGRHDDISKCCMGKRRKESSFNNKMKGLEREEKGKRKKERVQVYQVKFDS